jgi:hypothetical protein
MRLNEFLGDWKSAAAQLENGEFLPIYATADGKRFEVLRFSLFDEEVDGEKALIPTPVTSFTDRPAYYVHRTLYGSAARVLTRRDVRKFVLETGPEATEYLAARDGISPRALVRATRQGDQGRRLARRVKSSERKKQTALTWEIEVRDETIEELQAEIAALTAERNHLARELAARGSE